MKKACSALFFLILSCVSFSQTGTIKIAKAPPAKKDTLLPKGKAIVASAGSNYTFRNTGKFGYEAEVLIGFWHNYYSVGLKYCHENEFYVLSPYDKETKLPASGYPRSENRSDYLKIPVSYGGLASNTRIHVNRYGRFCLGFALVPEYLLKTTNQYGRLKLNDFNRFNLSGSVTLGIPLFSDDIFLAVSYSKDFLNNLKDKNIYNEQGTPVAKIRSKTDLLSFSLSCRIHAEGKQ